VSKKEKSGPTKLVKVPHLLYSSLYIRAGARFPGFHYFFQTGLGHGLLPLWWDSSQEAGRECGQVSLDETNMLMAGALPMPEQFLVHDIALLGELPAGCLDMAKYELRLGRRIAADGKADLLPVLGREHPRDYFSGRRPIPGRLIPLADMPHKYYGFEIEMGLYFTLELRGGPAKLGRDLRLWACLIGEWQGPVDALETVPETPAPQELVGA
jgi:hypothetical protein